MDRLPRNYLSNGYRDANGISHWVFNTGARMVADVLASQKMTTSSLRRFYNHLQAIKQGHEVSGDFNTTREKLYGFQAMVINSVSRGIVPAEFQKFVDANLILAQQSADNFYAFLEHYQSVIAYAYDEQRVFRIDDLFFPDNYLECGYYIPIPAGKNGARKQLREELFVSYPKQLVISFKQGQPKPLTLTTLRNFYNKVKNIQLKLRSGVAYTNILQDLFALERDTAYALNRNTIPVSFAIFMIKNITLAAKEEENFKGFAEHFQAVVAYAHSELKNQ